MTKPTNNRLKLVLALTFVVASLFVLSVQLANSHNNKPTPTAPVEKPVEKQNPTPVAQPEATPAIADEPTPMPAPAASKPAPTPAPQPAPEPPRPTVFSGGMNGGIISLVNDVRARAGLNPVYEHSLLNQSALIEANTLCAADKWAHGDFGGIIASVGYQYHSAGENLANNFSTAGGIVNAWTNSPSHYAQMTGNYVDIGSAVITCPNFQGKENILLIVNHFGRR